MLLAENDNFIARSSAYPCNDLSAGIMNFMLLT